MPTNARLTRAECSSLVKTSSVQVVFNSLGTIKYLKNVENKGISIIISAKQLKKAVARNKLRRRLYAIFCNFYKKHLDSKPVMAMLYVSKHSTLMTYTDLEKNFNDLLAKIQKNP